MIKSIGHLWSESDVFWGAGSQAGRLWGVPDRAKTADPTDFREQVGIYVLYANYDVVYVGQTGTGAQRLLQRLKKHRDDHLARRWNRFSWFGVRWARKTGGLSAVAQASHPVLAQVLNHFEAILIDTVEPALNSQSGRFGDTVIWYRQLRDDRLGPTTEHMIKGIWRDVTRGRHLMRSSRRTAAVGGEDPHLRLTPSSRTGERAVAMLRGSFSEATAGEHDDGGSR